MGPSKPGHSHVHKSDASQRLAASQNSTRNAQWEDCVRRCGVGDQIALSTLYDQASHLIYSVVIKVLGNQADAEEVTPAEAVAILTRASRFDSEHLYRLLRGRSVSGWAEWP